MLNPIIIRPDRDSLMIDLHHYIIFHYQKSEKYINHHSCSSLSTTDLFTLFFERKLQKLTSQYNVCWSNVYLVKDCKRSEIWRNAYYTLYKSNRASSSRGHTISHDTFTYIYDHYIPYIQQKYGFHVIGHSQCEADDIIAIMKNTIRNINYHSRVTIITNDNDFIQLIDENTSVVNLYGVELQTRMQGMAPKMYLQVKILTGDISDSIPMIVKDKVTAKQLISDEGGLDAFFEKHPDAFQQYIINQILIDFEYIPYNIRGEIANRIVVLYG